MDKEMSKEDFIKLFEILCKEPEDSEGTKERFKTRMVLEISLFPNMEIVEEIKKNTSTALPSYRIRSTHMSQSKSPVHDAGMSRHKRSSSKRCSRSPAGRCSRSPTGRCSRSPTGGCSRSPTGRWSRSPAGRRYRSPTGRRYRSPTGRRSRSPTGRCFRSPIGRRSRRSLRRHSRSLHRCSRSHRVSSRSPPRRQSERSPKRHLSHQKKDPKSSLKIVESLPLSYSPDKNSMAEDLFKTFVDFFEELPNTDINNMTLNKFKQFLAVHNSKIQELINCQLKAKPNMQETLILHKSLLDNLNVNVQALINRSNLSSVNQQPIDQITTVIRESVPQLSFQNQPHILYQQPHLQSYLPTVSPTVVPSETLFREMDANISKLLGSNTVGCKKKRLPKFVVKPMPQKSGSNNIKRSKVKLIPGPRNLFPDKDKNSCNEPGPSQEKETHDNTPDQYLTNQHKSSICNSETILAEPSNAQASFCAFPSKTSKGNSFPTVSSDSDMNTKSASD